MTTVTATGTLTVNSTLAVSMTINPNTINVGHSTTITASVSGGTGPYTYTWSGLPGGCPGADQSSITCSPSAIGTFNISVLVKDAAGITGNATGTLTVSPSSTLSVTLTIAPTTIDIGQSITLTATVTGGVAPYNYAWTGLPGGCPSANTNTITCTPSATGTFNVTVSVTDNASPVSTNLVQNPGFEIPSPTNPHQPANWWTYSNAGTPIYSYPEPGRTGGSSIAISYSSVVTGYALLGQSIDLTKLDLSKQYTLSGWINTQGVNGTGASYQIDWYGNNNSQYLSSISTNYFNQTTWTQLSKSGITIPSGADTARVLSKLYNCSGKAWFDDIYFGI